MSPCCAGLDGVVHKRFDAAPVKLGDAARTVGAHHCLQFRSCPCAACLLTVMPHSGVVAVLLQWFLWLMLFDSVPSAASARHLQGHQQVTPLAEHQSCPACCRSHSAGCWAAAPAASSWTGAHTGSRQGSNTPASCSNLHCSCLCTTS